MLNNLFTLENFWIYSDRFGIVVGDILMIFTIYGMFDSYYNSNSFFRKWIGKFKRNTFPERLATTEHTRWDGIIFTLSKEEVPRWVIQQAQPKIVGLLTTQQSQACAEALKNLAQQRQMRILEERINNVDDPFEAKRKTHELIQELQQAHATDIAVDITGGKTPMSLGAFMAAEEAGVGSIYITSDYKNNQADMSTAQIKTIIEPRQYS